MKKLSPRASRSPSSWRRWCWARPPRLTRRRVPERSASIPAPTFACGVKIGEVTDVKPQGRTVLVRMAYDASVRVPAGAKALIVPPSVVSDRYVQLAPAYTSGDARPMAPGCRWEDRGADRAGRDLRGAGQAQRGARPQRRQREGRARPAGPRRCGEPAGNGEGLHDTLDGLATVLTTLSMGGGSFGTVENLQEFTTMLAQSDGARARVQRAHGRGLGGACGARGMSWPRRSAIWPGRWPTSPPSCAQPRRARKTSPRWPT